jgi:hypothetical protein
MIILHEGSKLDKSILEKMTSLKSMVNKNKTYHDKTPHGVRLYDRYDGIDIDVS